MTRRRAFHDEPARRRERGRARVDAGEPWTCGVVRAWVRGLDARALAIVARRIERAGALLRRAVPPESRHASRERAALLLLAECARAKGLRPGELLMLLPDARRDAAIALDDLQRRDRPPRGAVFRFHPG